MKIRMDSNALARIVSAAQRAAPTGSIMGQPVLNCVHLLAESSALQATGTDLSTTVRATVPAKVERKGVAVTPMAVLAALAAQLPPGEVALETDEGALHIEAGEGSWSLAMPPPYDYPAIPSPSGTTVTFDPSLLGPALAAVAPYASDVAERPILTGLCLEADPEGLVVTATDGASMATKLIAGMTVLAEDERMLVRAKSLQAAAPIVTAAESMTIVFSPQRVALHTVAGDMSAEIVCGLIADDFPLWRGLLEVKKANSAIVDRAQLAAAVKRSAVVLADAKQPIKLSIDEYGVRVSTSGQDIGLGLDVVPAEVTGEPAEASFIVGRLLAMLDTMNGATLTLTQFDPKVVLIATSQDDPSLRVLLMPVRV